MWILNSPGVSFYRSDVRIANCRPEMGDFSHIADNMISATRTGGGYSQFAGAARKCDLVRAEYTIPSTPYDGSSVTRFTRTMCVDPDAKLILRDRMERGNASGLASVETTTFGSFERDIEVPAGLFQFRVPTGYFEDSGPEPNLIEDNGVYRLTMGITPPLLLSKIEPAATAEALRNGVSGIVLVSFQVDTDGNTRKMKVVRGLGFGLDENAVEAVRQWHFSAGAKDGVPVAVGPLTAAVNFAAIGSAPR